jgi:short-subunit dehydrogenase
VVLVTGSSQGLGLAIARALVAKNYLVILNGRDSKRLTAAARLFKTGQVLLVAGDCASPAFGAKLQKTLKIARIGHLDLVVHNAGINHMGTVEVTKLMNAAETLRVNSLSVINLAQATRPFLEKCEKPRFVLISSLMQYFAMPGRSVYAASKAAAEMILGAWQLELEAEHSPVRVQILRPAGIETGFHANTKTDGESPKSEVSRMQPEKIAVELLRLIESTRRERAPGLMNKFAAFVARHLPALTRRQMLKRYLKKPAG